MKENLPHQPLFLPTRIDHNVKKRPKFRPHFLPPAVVYTKIYALNSQPTLANTERNHHTYFPGPILRKLNRLHVYLRHHNQ